MMGTHAAFREGGRSFTQTRLPLSSLCASREGGRPFTEASLRLLAKPCMDVYLCAFDSDPVRAALRSFRGGEPLP